MWMFKSLIIVKLLFLFDSVNNQSTIEFYFFHFSCNISVSGLLLFLHMLFDDIFLIYELILAIIYFQISNQYHHFFNQSIIKNLESLHQVFVNF